MDESIIAILRNFNWAGDFRLPIASDKNKILELEVAKNFQKKASSTTKVECYQGNVINLKYHLRSVGEQRHNCEKMRSTYEEQQNVEKYSYKCIRNGKESLTADRTRISKSNKQLHDANEELKVEYEKLKGITSDGKTKIAWSKEMEGLSLDCVMDTDQGIDALTKCKERNNIKFEAVQVVRLKITDEVQEYESFLKHEFTRIVELECSLKKLMELHNQMRKKATWLLAQWQSIIDVNKARDNEIEQLQAEIFTLNDLEATLRNNLMEQKHFLDEQLRNNIQTEIITSRRQCLFTKRRTFKHNLHNEVKILNSLILERRNELFSLKQEISQKRMLVKITKNNVIEATNLRQQLIMNKRQVEEKYSTTKSVFTNIQQRISMLMEILKNLGKKRNEILQNYRKYEKSRKELLMSISVIEARSCNFNYELKRLQEMRIKMLVTHQCRAKQMDLLTNKLHEIKRSEAELTVHLRYLKGDEANELFNEQTNTLIEMSNFYSYQRHILQQNSKEIESFQREAKRLEKLIDDCNQQMNVVLKSKYDLLARIDIDENSITALKERNGRKITAENLVRIRMNNLENALMLNRRNVHSLQVTKAEMNAVARKYNLEVQSASNLLRNCKKLTKQEISDTKYRIEQINKRILQLMKRCEIIADGLRKDCYGAPLNLTNYKIQMVTERCTLLEKGDHLDDQIRKAEKEIQAMENTLTLLKISNEICETNFSSLKFDGEKLVNMHKQMKGKKIRWLTNVKKYETIISKLEHETREYQYKLLNEINSKYSHLETEKEEKTARLRHLQCRVYEQNKMINRVRSKITHVKRLLLSNQDLNMVLLQKEFFSKELLEVNKDVLQYITRVISQQDVNSFIRHYLSTKGISLPLGVAKKPTAISSDN